PARDVAAARVARDARDHADARAFLHVLGAFAYGQERADDVDVEELAKLGDGRLEERRRVDDPCGRDERVEPAERRIDFLEGADRGRFVGDVDLDSDAVLPGRRARAG